jgi:acetyl esterase
MALRDRVLPLLARALFVLPTGAQRVLGGAVPPDAAGLAPDAWLVARLARRQSALADDVSVDDLRERFARTAATVSARTGVPVAVEEITVAGAAGRLGARFYVPAGALERGPLLVFLHGGGWVEGSSATHDPSCRLLAHLAGVRIVSVDYRRAPEHPYPAAADDAVAAYRDVAARAAEFGADPRRLAVGGDSAGGNLAAVAALDLRGDPAAPAFQFLVYPGVDMTVKRPSRLRFGEGFLLTEENMTFYEDSYVPDRARRGDVRVSPLLAPDLAGLPPAYIATALADPLRDEGEAYAERLRAAGVPVALHRHPQIHGFFSITAMRSGMTGLALCAGALRQGLA